MEKNRKQMTTNCKKCGRLITLDGPGNAAFNCDKCGELIVIQQDWSGFYKQHGIPDVSAAVAMDDKTVTLLDAEQRAEPK